MDFYVISDLHLFDRQEEFLFNSTKERVFTELCTQILADDEHRDKALILAGDVFDLTGMNPCAKFHREFFSEALESDEIDHRLVDQVSRHRSTEELLESVKVVFPNFFKSLARVASAGKLIYLPGNHDCAFSKSPEVFSRFLGVEHGKIRWRGELLIGSFLIASHGNEYDASNRTDNGCDNPGSVFTSALYQGVLPALRMLKVDPKIIAAIPAVRPEEETILGLESLLGEPRTRKLLIAFARLLQRNGFFRGGGRLPAWFLSHDFPIISKLVRDAVTPEKIRGILPNDDRLKVAARRGAAKTRARIVAQRPELVDATIVFGHTHELDVNETNYVNLGTWIDHISQLTFEQISKPDQTLPVLHISPDSESALYDARPLAKGAALSACPILWRR